MTSVPTVESSESPAGVSYKLSINVVLFAVKVPYACAVDGLKPASTIGVPDTSLNLISPPSTCSITTSPVDNLLALTFIKLVVDVAEAEASTFAFTAVTKASASVPPSVTVIAELKLVSFFLDSWIVNVSELVKVGVVVLLVIFVVPPSYLNNWKSPTFGVVSDCPVIDCSVMLNCVYRSPTDNPVPPFAASNLKIAVW